MPIRTGLVAEMQPAVQNKLVVMVVIINTQDRLIVTIKMQVGIASIKIQLKADNILLKSLRS